MTTCAVCGIWLITPSEEAPAGDYVVVNRRDAKTCTPRCRQAASRRRRGVRHGWGDTIDRQARRSRLAAVVGVTGQ